MNEAKTVAVADIIPAAKNIHGKAKKNDAGIKSLADAIKSCGLLHRIAVRQDGDKYVIIDGHRRFDAIKTLGWTEVPCEVMEKDDAESDLAMLAANTCRTESDPILEAVHIEKMVKDGKTYAEIAADIGVTEGYIARRARLCNLTKEMRVALVGSNASVKQMEDIASFEKDAQDECAKCNNFDDWSPHTILEHLRNRCSRLNNAIFDTAPCKDCPCNTANHILLFEDEDGTNPCCEKRECFVKKHNEEIDRLVKNYIAKGESVKAIKSEYDIEGGWNLEKKDKPDKKHKQGYVFTDYHGLKKIIFVGKPASKKVKDARPKEEIEAEREAKRAKKEWNKNLRSAWEKMREAVKANKELVAGLVNTDAGTELAKQKLLARFGGCWVYDGDLQVLAELPAELFRGAFDTITDEEHASLTSPDPMQVYEKSLKKDEPPAADDDGDVEAKCGDDE